ncbi:MAG: glycosyltransferase, partial [Actinomycetota bacterium]
TTSASTTTGWTSLAGHNGRMRIALLAPLVSPIREPQIGGVATLLTDLAAGLLAAGHDVDLFGASGSAVDGLRIVDTSVDASQLAGTLFRPLGPAPGPDDLPAARDAFRTAYALIAGRSYDVVHNHAFDAPAIALAPEAGPPVVHTLHLPPAPHVAAALQEAARGPRPPTVAAVSASQRRLWERHVRIDLVLQPGVPTARIPWTARSEPGVLVAGRLSPEKGVLHAIAMARAAGRDLVVAGGPYDPAYAAEVEREARAGGVVLAGPLPRAELWDLMGRSAGLLFPVLWDEPFGMVGAEAQAAGCPVIGFRGGALPDVILEGTTGRLVEAGDLAAARRALTDLERYDRTACRVHAERSLDVAPMIAAHERLYARITGSRAAEPGRGR